MKQPIPFGKYFLLDRVNVGGMAEVFRAKATGVEGFERLVAVKRILPSIAEDEDFITMFIDEAKIAVQLTHANIAQIFDLGKVGESYFIALEYVSGRDLRAIFTRARRRKEAAPSSMACYVIMKVCEGLEYAHQKRDATGQFLNLVHRDVSPQNLLVSYEGEVKVIDFGIAKAVGKQGMTQAGMLKGKFGYMSPEQVEGVPIDRRSDIFGLGICLYELLTGERLFVAETDFATLEKVRAGNIMPPSTYNPQIPPQLEKIVMKALARDRDDRHQTAMELHDDLQAFLYTSGNLFGRKELSAYMRDMFAEEIEQERLRDQMYTEMELPDLDGADDADLADLEAVPVGEADLGMQHGGGMAAAAGAAAMAHAVSAEGGRRPGRGIKSTLLGVAPGGEPSTSGVPRPVPSSNSIPPGRGAPAADSNPQLGVQWDDEELSTQIYDRPDVIDDLTAELEDSDSLAPGTTSPPPRAVQPRGVPAAVSTPGPNSAIPPVGAAGAAGVLPAAGPALSGRPGPIVSAPIAPTTMPPPRSPSGYPPAQDRGRRSPMGAVLAVMLILGAIVGALLWFQPPERAVIHVSTVPADAIVEVNGTAVAGTSPFVLQDLAPEAPHELKVSREGFLPWTGRVTLQPGQTMGLPVVTLKRALGGFAIDSVPPGAAVFVDGAPTGKVTPTRITELAAGPHKVELRPEGQPAQTLPMVDVQPGVVTDLPVANLGDVTPARRRRPAAKPPTAPPTSSSAPRVRRPQTVAPEKPRTPVVLLKEDEGERTPEGTGVLRVNSRPWAVVFVDGKRIGNTPQRSIELPAGPHSLELVNDEFGLRKTVRVEIKPGQTVTRVITLDP